MRFVAGALALGLLLVPLTAAQTAEQPDNVRAAVTRALPLLQRSAATFVEKRSCVSCHHNVLPVLALHMASARGLTIDEQVLSAVEQRTFDELLRPSSVDEAIQGVNVSDPAANDGHLLIAAHAAGIRPSLTTAIYAHRLMRWQRGDHWRTSDFRPHHASSPFTATATAMRALVLYMPEELRTERDAALARARSWLVSTVPRSTEDAAFRLFGLTWSDTENRRLRFAGVRALSAMQLPSGGWPQQARSDADAYSTGEALVALHEAGMPATDPAWQRGLRFLLSTQNRDGTWRVRTRMISPATVSPPYFSTGFPHGKDEFLSYAGTAWATMALLSALPVPDERPAGKASSGDAARNGPGATRLVDLVGDIVFTKPAWLRPALFGDAGLLIDLVDSGLDPRSATSGGTTILMAAAADPDKVRRLLIRGASVTRRTSTGVDALTVATTYRGTAQSVKALLEAGAVAQPPVDARAPHAPVAYAAMAGELEAVNHLVKAGARGLPEALAEAVTFDHPDIVAALIAAGAGVDMAEPSGVTLLHWAVITNRPASIPLLVAAGAKVNAVDGFGFTPLMYAATLDHGNTAALEALLAARADRGVRNHEGRTPLEQARHLSHTDIVRVLLASECGLAQIRGSVCAGTSPEAANSPSNPER